MEGTIVEGKALITKRILAYLIDSLLVPLVPMAALVAVGAVLGLVAMPFMNEAEQWTPLIVLVAIGSFLGMGVGFIYFLIKDSWRRGSFGKRWLGLRVVRSDTGEPCGLGASLLRNLFLLISPLNLIEMVLLLTAADGQRLGDKVAKTKVIGNG